MTNSSPQKFRSDRLLALAEHLEHGKLGHKKFDFTTINDNVPHACGTAGCALGELPILFPRLWKFDEWEPVSLRRNSTGYIDWDVTQFFGILTYEYDMLFFPRGYTAEWNKSPLTKNATRKQVATGIRRFVKWKDKQLKAGVK